MTVPLADLDYQEAAKIIAAEAVRRSAKKKKSWQYKEGFQGYVTGHPLRKAATACFYEDSRVQWRLGWLTAMFIDLHNRDCVVTRRDNAAEG